MKLRPCAGDIQGARLEIVSGPDAGVATFSTATGYQLKNINWGRFRLRAARTGYVPADVSMDVLSPLLTIHSVGGPQPVTNG